MNVYSLSWAVGLERANNGGNKKDVKLKNVMEILDEVLRLSGALRLTISNSEDDGPQSLSVESENGLSVLSLGEVQGGEYGVRTYKNDEPVSGQVEIMGNFWDQKMVCKDLSLVKKIFEEFFLKGDVSISLLS